MNQKFFFNFNFFQIFNKDFETDPAKIQFSFSKNGTDMGIVFVTSKTDFYASCQNEFKYQENKFLFFPHVLSKNIVFEMNFGQRVSLIGDEPFAPSKNLFEIAINMNFIKILNNS